MNFVRFAAVVLVLALASCASKDEKKEALKAAPLVDFEKTLSVKKQWQLDAGKGQDKRYAKLAPAMSDSALFLADVDGNVVAYERETRKRLWKKDIKKDISGALSYAEGRLYLGTYDGEVLALSAEDGELLWLGEVSSEVVSVPAANDDVVAAQTIDGRLFGFAAETGEALWRYDHTVPALTLRGTASPVISRNQLLAAFGNGQVVSLNVADGALMWSVRVSQPKGRTELEKMVDVDASPLIDGGLIYSASYHGALAAFSKAKGQIIWKQDLSTFENLTLASGVLFAVNEESHVVAFNAGNGAILWTNDQMHRRNLGAPVVFGDYVASIDEDGHMHVLSQEDGRYLHRFKPSGNGFRPAPLSMGDEVWVLSDDGKLSAYTVNEKAR